MRRLLEDVWHALRLYRRTPGASLGVVAVLAIGMAFVAAFLSLYADLALRPDRGFEPGGRIVSISTYDGRNTGQLTIDLVQRLSSDASTLEHTAGSTQRVFFVGPDKKYTLGNLVTRDFFLGIRPRLAFGRGFFASEHDEHGDPVVVISWQYWQSELDGRPDVLGETLELDAPATAFSADGTPQLDEPPAHFRIVGVMHKTFTGIEPPTQLGTRSSFWIPVERALSLHPASVRASLSDTLNMRVVARRAAGASNAAVVSELEQRFVLSDFVSRAGARYDVADGLVTDIRVRHETGRQLKLFLGASVLVALVASANVGLFLLARAPGRRRELAIRAAVGASMQRLAHQLLSEAAVLVAAASMLGLALSVWMANALPGLPFLRQAQWQDVTLLDWRVLTLVALLLVLATLLVSLAPIAGLARMGIAARSRLVAARATLGQRLVGTGQIAVAGVLGSAAVAFGWYLAAAQLTYPGYRVENIFAAPYVISGVTPERGLVTGANLRDSLLAAPGVTAASLAMVAPGVQPATARAGFGTSMVGDAASSERAIRVRTVAIDPHYLSMLGLTLLHGRNLHDDDSGAAIVNQTFARDFFGREDVVGEPVPDAVSAAAGFYVRGPPAQIVGVVADFPSYEHPLAAVEPIMLTSGYSIFGGVVLIESTLPLSSLQTTIRQAFDEHDVELAGTAIVSLAKARNDMLAPDRARALLTLCAATIVVLLAAFGFYGTQRYVVMAGRREYAIRAAIGAAPAALGRLVLERGIRLAIPGALLALPLGIATVGWLRDYYIPRSISPYVVAIVTVLCLLGLALAASIGPARIARRTQPAELLREG